MFAYQTYSPVTSLHGLHGLGAADPYTVVPTPVKSIASIAAAGAATTGSLMAAMGVSAAAGPIGLAVSAAIGIGIAVAELFKGCGQSCIDATNIVNQAEPLFQQNVAAYLAVPVGQRTKSLQAGYLNNFDTLWQGLVNACNGVGGKGGAGCISGRDRNGCDYKVSPGGWQNINGQWTLVDNGPNGSGDMCWNWFVGYRDPIAKDPTVVPDSAVLGTANTTSGSNPVSNVLDSILPTNSGSGGSGESFPLLPVLLLAAGGILLTIGGD
jgi:hypothetical protein